MPASFNYYDILGLSKGAGAAEIKSAYRQLAMKYHPDQNPSPDAHKQFVAINAAYEVLGDPLKRKMYDLRKQAGDVVYRKQGAGSANPEDIDHEEMRRRYWTSPEGQRKSRELRKEALFFKKMNGILRLISIPLVLFMLLFLVERYFPKKLENQSVVYQGATASGSQGDIRIYHLYQFGGNQAWVKHKYRACLKEGDKVDVYLGRIFGLVSKVKLPTECEFFGGGLSREKVKHDLISPSESLFGGSIVLIYIVIALIGFIWWSPFEAAVDTASFGFALVISLVVFSLFFGLFP